MVGAVGDGVGRITLARSREELTALAKRLYERRAEGVIVLRKAIVLDDWRPEGNNCHRNVAAVVERDPRYSAIRGWICADYVEPLGVMRFFAHSVVQAPEGGLIDVTPNPLPWQYAFLRHDGTDEEFADLVEECGIVSLLHVVR